jgi:hypothetical protein
MIRISSTADLSSAFEGKVKPEHIATYPREYAVFQRGEELPDDVNGTSLMNIKGFTKKLEEEYADHHGIFVAEQLAAVSDDVCRTLGGNASAFRDAARRLTAWRGNATPRQGIGRHELIEIARSRFAPAYDDMEDDAVFAAALQLCDAGKLVLTSNGIDIVPDGGDADA